MAKLGPLPTRRTWEQLGRLDPPLEKPLLTEVAVSWSHPSKLSRKKFSVHLAYLATGIPSESFPFSEVSLVSALNCFLNYLKHVVRDLELKLNILFQEMKSFVLAKNILVEGISPEAVSSLVKPLISYGTSHYHLNSFANSNERSLIVQVKNLCPLIWILTINCISPVNSTLSTSYAAAVQTVCRQPGSGSG